MSSINQIASQAQVVFPPPGEILPKPTSATAEGLSSVHNKPNEIGPSAAAPETKADTKADPGELDKAVTKTNDFLQSLTSLNLQFSVDKDTSRTIVKVVDPSTKEVVRQIPSEEVIAIAKSLDRLQGLLIKDKA